MKKGLIITLIVLAILVLISVAIFIMVNKSISNEGISDITMTIEEGTLTKTSATIIIKGKDFNCGEDYSIEKKEDDKWKSVTQIRGYWINAVSHSSMIGKLDFNLDWSERYGELENGEYRLVKLVSTSEGTKEIYAEFTIK